jgi:glycosyltransferase involved in cell wall biosynthesis
LDQRVPLVTIGMPTFNGARFLAGTIEALLAQDYPNTELVISDNASTDGTEAIARRYAGASDRIRYVRQERNLGAAANFNTVLGLARGAYFMWAADHDLWQPNHVSACVAALEADPGAVLAYPRSLLIDENGAAIEEMDDQIDLDQPSALDRYKRLIWRLDVCNMIYGVARREAMAATGGFPDVISPDHVVLARLVLLGRVVRVDGQLYRRRANRPPETIEQNRERALVDLNPALAPDRSRQSTERLYRDLRDLHMRAIDASSLSFGEKLDARLATLACFRQRFGVDSVLSRVVRRSARIMGQTARLDRRLGLGA